MKPRVKHWLLHLIRLIACTALVLGEGGCYKPSQRQRKASFALTAKAGPTALDVALRSEVSDEDAMFSNTHFLRIYSNVSAIMKELPPRVHHQKPPSSLS